MNKNQNPNCCGSNCINSKSRVKILNTGGSSSLTLCRSCFGVEMDYRIKRNKKLGSDLQYKLSKWRELKDYKAI